MENSGNKLWRRRGRAHAFVAALSSFKFTMEKSWYAHNIVGHATLEQLQPGPGKVEWLQSQQVASTNAHFLWTDV